MAQEEPHPDPVMLDVPPCILGDLQPARRKESISRSWRPCAS